MYFGKGYYDRVYLRMRYLAGCDLIGFTFNCCTLTRITSMQGILTRENFDSVFFDRGVLFSGDSIFPLKIAYMVR